jgi:hypothetical protein
MQARPQLTPDLTPAFERRTRRQLWQAVTTRVAFWLFLYAPLLLLVGSFLQGSAYAPVNWVGSLLTLGAVLSGFAAFAALLYLLIHRPE